MFQGGTRGTPMAFEDAVIIQAPMAALFELTQDYGRRLDWDPFLKKAELVDGAAEAGVGVKAWCVARSGFGMETEYVSFKPPERVAVKMTRGPWFLDRFAGSWRFEPAGEGHTRVLFKYHLSSKPGWMGFALDPVLHRVFARDTRRRLEALKRFVEAGGLMDTMAKTC